jgi:choline dehydrogenase
LQISYGNYVAPSIIGMSAAMDFQGLEHIDGFQSGKLIGYSGIPAALDPRTATRSSSETSFLQAGAKAPGLKIYPNALAKRIVFDDNKKATGVTVKGNSQLIDLTWTISASKEVIVSAGVVSTLSSFPFSTRKQGRGLTGCNLVAFTSTSYGVGRGTC